MDLIDQLKALSQRISKQSEMIQTEEATKNAFVMPFISALGYNVFDPTEVMPEFTADVGVKKGEKVDYAILKDGAPILLFECKWRGTNLDKEHASQLYRYFSTTSAKIGVLTNGIRYKFFSDLDEPNKMDAKPFYELDMLEITDDVAEQLKKFAKSSFDLEGVLHAAGELKYTREIKRVVKEQFFNPSEEFVRFFASQVYDGGKLTQQVRQRFAEYTARALKEFITDQISEKFKSVINSSEETQAPALAPAEDTVIVVETKEGKILTSEEEIEAYQIVRAILIEVIDPKRIVMRDTASYCGILLDDNNRKPICRLRFNGASKSITVMDSARNEEKIAIQDLSEIFRYSDKLKAAVASYEKQPISVE